MKNVDTILKRIQRYYESNASAESDIAAKRDILISYSNLIKLSEQYLNRTLIENGKNGPFYYISTGLGAGEMLPEPASLSTRNMIIISSKDIFEKNYGNFLIIFCLGKNMSASNLTGLFARTGYRGLPSIYIYIDMDKIDYSFGQVTRERFRNIIANNFDVRKTYVHEIKHYLDWITALAKNPLADPIKKYKTYRDKPTPEELRDNPNITTNYAKYINQTSEVNARYAEWLVSIMYSFDRLPNRKKQDIISVYPTFNLFWDYMWAEHAPDEFIEHASPKVVRYLQRRLYKFYDYIRDMERPPKTESEARRLVQEYLKRDKTNAA